jgi:uncharacterized protein
MTGLRDAGADAASVIQALDLRPHPEGGHYRETWRDAPADGTRGAGTAILFLLRAHERSHWHRVDAVELWLWQAGAALELRVADLHAPDLHAPDLHAPDLHAPDLHAPDLHAPDLPRADVPGAPGTSLLLGPDVAAGEALQGLVPKGAWQSAASLGAWTLCSCVVTPAFSFAGFELAPPGWEPGPGTR